MAREQAAKLAGEVAKQAAADFQAKGLPVLKAYAQLIGIPTLVAMACILIGWFFFAAVSVEFLGDELSATFYDFMRVLNDPQNGLATIADQASSGAGFYGFLCIVALLAPLVPHVIKRRETWLAYCAPAAWMVLAALIGAWKVNAGISEAQRQFGGGGMPREFVREAMSAVSIGFGIYLAAAAALYLAYVGVQRYRAPAAASTGT